MKIVVSIFFIISTALAQVSYRPITDIKKLTNKAIAKTVTILRYDNVNKTNNEVRATGTILEGGFIITNEHVFRTYLSEEDRDRYRFWIYTTDLQDYQTFKDISIIACDDKDDICLLKIKNFKRTNYFSLERAPFKKATKKNPTGLFEGEHLFYIGNKGLLPTMQEVLFVEYRYGAYFNIKNSKKHNSESIQLKPIKGKPNDGCFQDGDSGGPIFDNQFYLYGMVRDTVFKRSRSDDLGVPINIIRSFVNKNKNKSSFKKINTFDPKYK